MGLTKPRAYQIFDIDYKQAVRVVTTSNITLSGGAPSLVDGVTLSLNDRVLVTGQSTGSQNGLYYVTTVGTGANGTWARSVDGNETGEIQAGMIVMVTEGTSYADTQWKLTTNDPITIGSTSLTFVLAVQANLISSGSSNVVVNSNANVTISSAGTANVLTVSSTGAVVGGTLSVTGNLVGAVNATANITGGNLLTGGRIYAPNGSLSAPSYGFSNDTDSGMFLTGDGNVAITTNSGIRLLVNDGGANVTGAVNITSTVSAAGNVTGGNLRTAGQVSATGIVSGQELTSTNSQAGEGGQINLALPSSGSTIVGNIIIDVYNNLLRFFEGGGTNRGAYIDITSAAAGVGTNLLAGGGGGTPGGSNTYVQFNDASAFGGNAQFTYDKVTNTLTAGIISSTNNGNGTNFKVGDDIYLGDINAADTLGLRGIQNAANAYIVFGNANGTALGRAGTGPLTYGGAFSATGNIDGGNLRTVGLVTATGNVTGGNVISSALVQGVTLSASGNVVGGNVTTGGLISATGNVTGGNIISSGILSVTGRTFVASGNAALPGITFSADTSQDTGFYWISDGNIGVSTNGTLRVTFNNAGGIVATGNISGGNILTAGLISATGNVTGGNLILAGSVIDTGDLVLTSSAANANVTLTPTGTGTVIVNKNITNGQANGVGNIGSSTGYFNTVFAKATSAQYADLAEMYVADAAYAPGTVVEFGGEYEITISSTSHSTAVAGIVSTNPSYLMNSTQVGEYVLPIALTGRVPCQVQGPVRKGDVLVSASTPGVAQRIGMNWQPGCVLGKAMEVIDTAEIQTIEVAVGRL